MPIIFPEECTDAYTFGGKYFGQILNGIFPRSAKRLLYCKARHSTLAWLIPYSACIRFKHMTTKSWLSGEAMGIAPACEKGVND